MKGILVAVSPEGIIGKDNSIPWHYPEDLKRFKKLTLGKTVIMGRNTWESIPEKQRPLPDRRNIVITRTNMKDVECFSSIEKAVDTCKGENRNKRESARSESIYERNEKTR
jgi:dihydrofolate reductase